MPDLPLAPATDRPALLQVRSLHHAFHTSRGSAQLPPLFTDLSFDLPAGVTLLDGDMGCGKTTLLRLLAGELPLQRGEVRLLSRPPRRPPHLQPLGADPAADRRAICWFDPRDAAFDQLTAAGLFATLRARHPAPPGVDATAWQAAGDAEWQAHVEGFGLAPHLAKPLYMLSTGSRRKAALAVALACRCPLTLLDDPTAGLDRPALDWLAEVLVTLAEESAEGVGDGGDGGPSYGPAGAPPRALLLVNDGPLEGLPGVHTLRLPAGA